MNREELGKKLVKRGVFGTASEANNGLKLIFDEIAKQTRRKGEVALPGFGKFLAVKRNARKGRNPHTGEEIEIAAKVVPVFKPAAPLKREFAGA